MPAPRYQVPKGTRDIADAEADAFSRLEKIARRVFHMYAVSEVRTPLFEGAELFSRSLGETSDVVEKEMFVFTDRGDRSYALRPEGTAGVVRFFIENSLWAKAGVHRLFYMGPMFRAERPQAGRYRQFWQIGSEVFGSADATADAETVVMVSQILLEFGVPTFDVQVNTLGCGACRPQHRESLLNYLKAKESLLTDESRNRMKTNPLRVLDSKEDGPKLADAPAMKNFLCPDCTRHNTEFLALLSATKLNIIENNRLVRGLDYYTRSVFEFTSSRLGAQSALAAGGRYDDLVQHLGGPGTPAVGFALGMDRVVMARESKDIKIPEPGPSACVVIPMIPDAVSQAFRLAESLRRAGVRVPFLQPSKKLKNQLAMASEIKADFAVIIGEDELKADSVTIKNLLTREQKHVALDKVLEEITC